MAKKIITLKGLNDISPISFNGKSGGYCPPKHTILDYGVFTVPASYTANQLVGAVDVGLADMNTTLTINYLPGYWDGNTINHYWTGYIFGYDGLGAPVYLFGGYGVSNFVMTKKQSEWKTLYNNIKKYNRFAFNHINSSDGAHIMSNEASDMIKEGIIKCSENFNSTVNLPYIKFSLREGAKIADETISKLNGEGFKIYPTWNTDIIMIDEILNGVEYKLSDCIINNSSYEKITYKIGKGQHNGNAITTKGSLVPFYIGGESTGMYNLYYNGFKYDGFSDVEGRDIQFEILMDSQPIIPLKKVSFNIQYGLNRPSDFYLMMLHIYVDEKEVFNQDLWENTTSEDFYISNTNTHTLRLEYSINEGSNNLDYINLNLMFNGDYLGELDKSKSTNTVTFNNVTIPAGPSNLVFNIK